MSKKLDEVLENFNKLTTEWEEQYHSEFRYEEKLGLDLKGQELSTLILGAFAIDNHEISSISFENGVLQVKLKKG